MQVHCGVADRCELEGVIDGPKSSGESVRDAPTTVAGCDRVLREHDLFSSFLCDSKGILLPLPLPDN